MTLSPKRGHTIRFVDSQGARAHLGVEEARRNNVNAAKLAPLTRKRFAKVRDVGLGRVVDGLICGHVHDVAAHTGSDDEVAEALALEDGADVFRTEDDAVNCSPVSTGLMV